MFRNKESNILLPVRGGMCSERRSIIFFCQLEGVCVRKKGYVFSCQLEGVII